MLPQWYLLLPPAAAPMVPAAVPMVPAAAPIMVPAAAPMVTPAAPMVPTAAPMVPAAVPMVPAAVPMVPAAAPMVPAAPLAAAVPMAILNDHKRKQPSCEERSRAEKRNCTMGDRNAAHAAIHTACHATYNADHAAIHTACHATHNADHAAIHTACHATHNADHAAIHTACHATHNADQHAAIHHSCHATHNTDHAAIHHSGHATATFASLTALPTAVSPIPGASSHSHALSPTVPTVPSSLTSGATPSQYPSPSPPQHAKNSPPNPNASSATDSASAGAAAAPPSPPPNSIPFLIPTSPSANATHSPGHPSHHNKILDTYISMMSANMQPHEALAKMAPMLSTLDDNNLLSLALMTKKACINLQKLAEALFNRFANQVNMPALLAALGNGRNQGSMPALLAALGNGMNQRSMPALLAALGNGRNQGSMPALLAALGNGMNQGSMPTLQAPHCFPSAALVSNNISVGGASGVINVTTIPPSASIQRPDISNSSSSDSASLQTDMQQQARDPDTFWMVDD
ncbi:hypothetical protein CEUSTIGMA_g4676.t1 [Chlamydomonas eustigma]|uniref:Uncharacterized protein n=1 Tax=Chlamydomonas eustigma TaxID=1157962 RepID=A0A250X382_9CHLO|nr:hypothetical protein CEUSTIGMA_g4676.t1 [Chlamydomonas eustigma]|eukprot:GAX77230.1 hypothetical protein CEUSTIGMA_g4676.t1 [Chlamydomonas eustigma]